MSGAPPGKEAAVELTSGQARYLLAVYHLGLGARGVRCADIARMLDVTRPSVVKMLSFFSQRCLIARERYGKVYLTDTGCLLARCYARLRAAGRAAGALLHAGRGALCLDKIAWM